MPLGEVLQDRWTILANCRQLKPLRLKSWFGSLQLHELRLAEGTPIGGAEKEEDRALRSLERLVGVCMTELIGESKSWRLLTDLQANRKRKRVIGGRVFLTIHRSAQSRKEKDSNHRDPQALRLTDKAGH